MIARWLAVIGVVAVLLVASCGGGDDFDTTDVDVDALLLASADRMEEETAFHFELELENGRIQIVRGINIEHAEGDIAGPERLYFKVEARIGPLLAELEMISLPGEGWITNPLTGRWEREQIDLDQFFDPADGITATMRAIYGAEVTGTQTVDGTETYRVEATVDSEFLTLFGTPQSGVDLRLKAWIGVDDPLVHRIEVVGGILAAEEDDLIRRLNLSQFGADFDIKAPR